MQTVIILFLGNGGQSLSSDDYRDRREREGDIYPKYGALCAFRSVESLPGLSHLLSSRFELLQEPSRVGEACLPTSSKGNIGLRR